MYGTWRKDVRRVTDCAATDFGAHHSQRFRERSREVRLERRMGNTFSAGSSGYLVVCVRRAVRSSGHVVLLFTPQGEK